MSRSKQIPAHFSPSNARKRRFNPSVMALALAGVLAVPGTASANYWSGFVDNNWFNAGNWLSPAAVPTAASGVIIDATKIAIVSGGAAFANNVNIGISASGALAIVNGGKLTTGYTNMANLAGSSGIALVEGAGSTWKMASGLGILVVGGAGSASVVIRNGGTVSNSMLGQLGAQAGSSGTVTVSGAGSNWTSGTLAVGNGGTGTLEITGGGTVNNGNATLGNSPAGIGMVTVDGLGSAWNSTGIVEVAHNGTGTLVIKNGGQASDSTAKVGDFLGSTGTVTVQGAGSTWNHSADLYLGNHGSGTMTVSNGGTVTDHQGFVGTHAGSQGAVTVDGPSSIWANTGSLFVGHSGTGTLSVANGGMVSSFAGYVGNQAGSTGTANIDGVGSEWTNAGNLSVGHTGTGTLTITHGGRANSSAGYVGNLAGSTGTVNIDGAGSEWTNAGNLSVGHSGTGALALSNGGLASSFTGYVGNQAGSIGTVNINGAGSSWTNVDKLFVGNMGTGTLTLANGGKLSTGGNMTLANQVGSVGTLNIGGAPGAPAVAPGLLSAPAIFFGAGTGTLNFNHSDLSTGYNFSTTLVGAGTLNQNAGWTNLMEDSSLFTGPTHVNGGRLVVYGGMNNSLFDVNNGGTLGGNGYVGGTVVNAGGTVAPGTISVGTLNVVGDIQFAAGSNYQVHVNSGGYADKIVAETATLRGGTVQVLASLKGATYKPSTSYTIVSATGGVTGTFADVTSNAAFLDPSLSYDPTHVYLTMTRNSKSFASVSTNALQRSTGASVESLALRSPDSPVYQAVVTLSAEQARTAFDQLSGEVHASARGVQLESSHLTRDVSLARLRSADSEDTGNDGGGASEDGSSTPRLLRSLREPSFWSRAMGSWGTMDGNGAASVKRDSAGFMMGADTRVGEEGRFGLMGGYGRSNFDVSTRSASGSSKNYTVGAYGGSRWGELALRGGVAYTWQDVSTRRSVAFAGFTDSLQADYKASTTQVFAELGYRIKTEKSELEPFVNLSHVNAASDGFTERGGAASLTSAGNSSGVTFSTLGLRASRNLDLSGGGSVTARGALGWRHAFGDTAPAAATTFAGSSAFEMTGAPVAKSVGVVEAGLDFKLTNTATLGITYGGQFGSGLKEHSARIQLNVAF